MSHFNLAVLHGELSSDPRRRELPSGSTLTQLELTTRLDGDTVSVPVSAFDREIDGVAGDRYIVIGYVRRRFFRAGGTTQSRTEVVASRVIPARRRATAERSIARAVAELDAALVVDR